MLLRMMVAVFVAASLLLGSGQTRAESRVSAEVGALGYFSASSLLTGFRFAGHRANALRVEVGFGVLPALLPVGVLVFAGDVGVVYPLPAGGGVTLDPHAGLSTIGAFAGQYGGMGFGWHGGLRATFDIDARTAAHADYTYRRFASESEALPVWSFTTGLSWAMTPRVEGHDAADYPGTGSMGRDRGRGR